MTKYDNFTSVIGPYLCQYIENEQEMGRLCQREKAFLARIDEYCHNQGLEEPIFTEDFINGFRQSLTDCMGYIRGELLRNLRKFSSFLHRSQPESYVLAVPIKQEYIPKSIFAPFIKDFVDIKRSEGLKYLGESQALKSFDKYCCEMGIQHTCDATESFVRQWNQWKSTVPHHKDYIYAVRDLLIYMKAVKNIPVCIPRTRFREAHPPMAIAFSSVFAALLEQFIQQKVSTGFKYESHKKILRYFDLLCIEAGLEEPVLNREIVQSWSVQRPTESAIFRVKRVSAIRQFALFLISRGFSAYIAPTCPSAPIDKPHIFRDEELVAFFACCEHYQAISKLVKVSLPVLFRFYHCLGLRLNEPLGLECKDLDLDNGRLHIRMGKGLKDRVLYLPADLLEVARQYNLEVGRQVPGRKYFFVSDLLGTGLRDTSVCRYFDNIWAMTEHAGTTDKKPTIHCFRHTMVVRKLEQWYREKEDYTYWLPYLCAFLGHVSLKDTYHYIQLVDSSFPVIRDSMQLFEYLYPEEAAR